jgi:hypothetical protein
LSNGGSLFAGEEIGGVTPVSVAFIPAGEVIGPCAHQRMKSGFCSTTTRPGSAPSSPCVISTGGIMGLRPTKVMKNGSCSATTVAGTTALPFVISTEAKRSGEICGPAALSGVLSVLPRAKRKGEIAAVQA